MLASSCPGWVCYAEKTHGDYVLPFISTAKSPQVIKCLREGAPFELNSLFNSGFFMIWRHAMHPVWSAMFSIATGLTFYDGMDHCVSFC